jgi:hypothetical protein
LVINREGNYDAVVASLGNSIGSVWNAWQTTWSGVVQRDDDTEGAGTTLEDVDQQQRDQPGSAMSGEGHAQDLANDGSN